MQIKTTISYHPTPIRIAIKKQTKKKPQNQKINVGKDVKKLEPLGILSGNVK